MQKRLRATQIFDTSASAILSRNAMDRQAMRANVRNV